MTSGSDRTILDEIGSAGGLAPALNRDFAVTGLPLGATDASFVEDALGLQRKQVVADVGRAGRAIRFFIDATIHRTDLGASLRGNGTTLAHVHPPSIAEAARIARRWLVDRVLLDAIAAEFRPRYCVQPETDASVDAAAAVLRGWQSTARHMPELAPLVEVVLRHPALRHFFPVTSHYILGFERCIQYPFARAVDAYVWPEFRVDEDKRSRPTGLFTVEAGGQRYGGPVTAEQAVAIIEPHIPPDWARAVYGTAASLPY